MVSKGRADSTTARFTGGIAGFLAADL